MDATIAQSESAERLVIADHTQVVWPRFLAFIGDTIVISLLVGIAQNVYGTISASYVTSGYSFQSANNFTWVPFQTSTSSFTVPGAMLITLFYFTMQEWLFGATFGKAWFHLHVTGVDGQRLTFRAALLRNLLRPIDDIFFIGALLIRFSFWHQRIGDRVAHTIVVGNESLAAPLYSRRAIQRGLIFITVILALFMGVSAAFNYYGRPQVIVQGLHYAQSAPFEPCVTAYTLGAPTRTSDTITYPVTYQIDGGSAPAQQGSITLGWQGFLSGWQFQNGIGANCPTRSTP